MSVTVDLHELIGYSDHERRKWRDWIAADPSRLAIRFQEGGRFPTVGQLLDHLFLVERRHLSRLEGGTPPDSTGVPAGDWAALFDYADRVRADFRRFVSDLEEARGHEPLTFTIPSGPLTVARRKLATHIVLHEVRHFAQIAYAARVSGIAPPGEHDYLFFPER
jgi:uncharacterized damage-inducible protein DinB